ncbi:MAG: serine/threonine protein kinase [Lentisphaeria bacterium]|nr:serine/threonine protein kinase [Lentisphaeria bacterium]NQZ69168.1 serine/threonine protein kinase [Lentisphaeria bacterium]
MELIFACPHCKSSIEADSTISGDQCECPACGELILVPAPGITIGMDIGGFIIEKRLGVGGMGEVFKARQKAMDREVALKVLAPGVTNSQANIDRFMHEVKMSGKLEHPNIVTAFDAGESGGYHYMAMSYVPGQDLDQMLDEKGPFEELHALQICLKVADALQYAWDEFEMLHRDIKPANIMIDLHGEVKLMDMGIAKQINENSNLTMQGGMVGTPYYISPEQATGKTDIDCRADIYSLGATLYHLITGTRPFDAPNAMAVIAKQLTETVESPINRNPNISQNCSNLIVMLMEKDRTNRPKNWQELKAEIHKVLEGESPSDFAEQHAVNDEMGIGVIDDIGLKDPAKTSTAPATISPVIQDVAAANDSPDKTSVREAKETLRKEGYYAEQMEVEKTKKAWGVLWIVVTVIVVLLMIGGAVMAVMFKVQRNDEAISRKNQELEELREVNQTNIQLAKVMGQEESDSESLIKLRAIEEQLDEAKLFMAKNPGNFTKAKDLLKTVKFKAQGTSFEIKVEEELAKLENRKVDAPKQYLKDLKEIAEDYAKVNQYEPAAFIFLATKSPYASQTKKERWKLLLKYRNKAVSWNHFYRAVDKLVKLYGKREFEKLRTELKIFSENKKYRAFKDEHDACIEQLKTLLAIHDEILKIYKRRVGKKISLNLLNKKDITGTLTNVRGRSIFVNKIEVPIRDIHSIEIYQLFKGRSDPEYKILKAFMALEAGIHDKALSQLKKQNSTVAQVLRGIIYKKLIVGRWHSTAFSGTNYDGKMTSLKVTLRNDGNYALYFGKIKQFGTYSVRGNWIYLSSKKIKLYWEIKSFKDKNMTISNRPKVYVDLEK